METVHRRPTLGVPSDYHRRTMQGAELVPSILITSTSGESSPAKDDIRQESAEDVLRALTPACSPAVLGRLRKERLRTASDLAALDKDDLRALGLTMAERCRVLKWASGNANGEGPERVATLVGTTSGSGTPGRGTATKPYHRRGSLQAPLTADEDDTASMSSTEEDEEAERRRLSEVEQRSDFWCRLTASSPATAVVQQMRMADRTAANQKRGTVCHSQSLRETVLEEQFDLTPERVQEVYRRTRDRAGIAIITAAQLGDGLRRCGLLGVDESMLQKAMEAVTNDRCSNDEHTWCGLKLAEFEVILSRLKLGQLMSDVCLATGAQDAAASQITVTDYDTHDVWINTLTGPRLVDFFFGHRPKSKPNVEVAPVRWVHLSGRHLTLLLALTVKYRLHPLGVEGVLEQNPTKIDCYGAHYFLTIDQLCLVNNTYSAMEPVQVEGRHISVICTGPPALDTVVTIVQEDRSFAQDWPAHNVQIPARMVSGEPREEDHWVGILRQRLQAVRSRVRERRVDFLVYQIVDLCTDDLVGLTRAYASRLTRLEEDLKPSRSGDVPPPSGWLSEVAAIRLQLAVVARRGRSLHRLLKRIEEDPGLSAGLASYLEDVADHLDEAHEDANQLSERCVSLSSAYEHAVDKEQEKARQRSRKQERARAEVQNQHSERLSNTLFILTVATAVFAPVQLLAGVYGMNFVNAEGHPTIPELLWPHGYLFFWVVVLGYLSLSGLIAKWLFGRMQVGAILPEETSPTSAKSMDRTWSFAPARLSRESRAAGVTPEQEESYMDLLP